MQSRSSYLSFSTKKLIFNLALASSLTVVSSQAVAQNVENNPQTQNTRDPKPKHNRKRDAKEPKLNSEESPVRAQLRTEKREIAQDKKELRKDKRDLKKDEKLLRAVEKRYGADSAEAAQLRQRVEDSQAGVAASQAELARDQSQRDNYKKLRNLNNAERKLEKKYDRMVQKHGEDSKDAKSVEDKLSDHRLKTQQLIEENESLSEGESHHGN